MYRRQMDAVGEDVTFQRVTSPGLVVSNAATVKARLVGYQEEDLSGERREGERHLIVLHDDLVAASFPVPPNDTDRVVHAGRTLQITRVDGDTRRAQGTQIAYDVWAVGAPRA
jgi:hypothetical protein